MIRRPKTFEEFNGQPSVVNQLRIAVRSAKLRKQLLSHTLFLGPAGLGKTTFGLSVIPNELGIEATMFNCACVTKPQDILPTLTSIKPGSILFLDEVHALAGTGVYDALLSLLEGSTVTINVGEGNNKRILTVQVEPYTILAATTRESSLPEPLRDRFRHQVRFTLYDDASMAAVLKWTATQTGASFNETAITPLVAACHGTARHAVRLVEACVDTIAGDERFADRDLQDISRDVVLATLERLGYQEGLTAPEFDLLERLHRAPQGKLGLSTLASVLDEETRTVEQVYEPYLLQKGLIVKTTNGRQITPAGQGLVQIVLNGNTRTP